MLKVSYSRIKAAFGCPRAFRYAYIDGLHSPEEGNSLLRGKAVHKTISKFLTHKLAGLDFRQSIDLATKETGSTLDAVGGKGGPEEAINICESVAYRLFPYHVSSTEEGISVYTTLFGIDCHIWIIPDVIIEKDGRIWIGEIKTTKRYDPRIQRLYFNEPQPWFYAHVWELANGVPHGTIAGTILFVGTPKECFVEEIPSTVVQRHIAKEFLEAGVKELTGRFSGNSLPHRIRCLTTFGECAYMPLCSAMTNPAYYDDLLRSLYTQSDPDARWPAIVEVAERRST